MGQLKTLSMVPVLALVMTVIVVALTHGITTLTPCMLHPVFVNNFDDCSAVVPGEATTDRPSIRFMRALKTLTYTVLMTDPDAPAKNCSPFAYVKHWLVSNISACSLKEGLDNLETAPGAVVHQEYFPPGPPMGIHRYQFIVFEEPPGQSIVDTQPGVVVQFNISNFVASNSLRAVGSFEYQVDSGLPENCTQARIDEIVNLLKDRFGLDI